MRNFIFLIIITIPSYFQVSAQHNLFLTDAYYIGGLNENDTICVFSRELDTYEVFVGWDIESDIPIEFLDDSTENRLKFKMPDCDVRITAYFDNIPTDFLTFEEIMGADILKPVYSAFPDDSKGTVFIFHGTSGSADGWVGDNKYVQFEFIKELFYNGYGVIITECEESTLGTDLNGDSKIRWHSYPLDSVSNIDYLNMIAIRDTFNNRGLLQNNKIYSAGMSAGGGFSSTFSYFFNAQAAAIYNASGTQVLIENTEVPIQYCMAPADSTIGQEGNDDAWANYQILLSRDICSEFNLNQKYPLYPECFMKADLSESESEAIFNEIHTNGFMFDNYVPKFSLALLVEDVQNNSGNWTNLLSAGGTALQVIKNIYSVHFGDHNFYSNHNQRTIKFFDDPCGISTLDYDDKYDLVNVYPNPTSGIITICGADCKSIELFDMSGKKQNLNYNSSNTTLIDLSSLKNGVYLFIANTDRGKSYKKIIINK